MSRPMRRRVTGKGVGPRPKRSTPRRRDAPRFDADGWTEANMLLAARCRGMCERCGNVPPVERHHRRRRRDGGDRLSNLLMLCTDCHRTITDQPESVTLARSLGYIVPALAVSDVETYPVHLWGSTWVLLDDAGGATACSSKLM